jgi:hypothetical protein
MSIEPAGPTATDQTTGDPTALVPADHVTAAEIVGFLRHLAELREVSPGNDPGARAAFLARKAELLHRIAASSPTSTAPEGLTP